MTEHPKEKGEKTEAIVLSELVRRGYTVLDPFGDNERYDYGLDIEGELVRVQVKTGRMVDGSVKFSARTTGDTKRIDGDSYHGDADWFVVYCYETDEVYSVRVENAGVSSKSLRVEEAQIDNGQIDWAENYTLDSNPIEV